MVDNETARVERHDGPSVGVKAQDEFLEFLGVVKEQTGRNDFGDFCDDLLLIAGG